jgi:hypothetical protein
MTNKSLRVFGWRGLFTSAQFCLLSALLPQPAAAGLYQDDLSRCIVTGAKPDDRQALMRWVFGAMATNPQIKDMARISDEEAVALNRATALLIQRLMLVDCRSQTIEAIKYEGGSAVQAAFSTLGQTAMSDLMRGDAASAYTGALGTYLDQEKWGKLMEEAGAKPPVANPK